MRIWETFSSLFSEGGWVLYPIFLVSVFTWFIALGKLAQYHRIRKARKKFLFGLDKDDYSIKTGSLIYDALLGDLSRRKGGDAERSLSEFVSRISPRLGYGLSTMGACIVIAPLLGLLGTISGMNEMFAIIGAFGFGSPTIMASGSAWRSKPRLPGLLSP